MKKIGQSQLVQDNFRWWARICMPLAVWLFCISTLADTATEHQWQDVINVRDLGAVGDGKADDTAALQNAVDQALRLAGGLKPDVTYDRVGYAGYAPVAVYLPRGTYVVHSTIRIPFRTYSWNRALRITGESAKIKAGSAMDSVMHVDTASHLTIQGLTIDAAGLAQHGFTAFKISGRSGLVERVNVGNAISHGIVLEKCQGSVFRNVSSSGNGGHGWHILDCNAAMFEGCSGNRNQGNGFTVAAPDFSGGCSLSGFWSEGNKGHGVELDHSVHSLVVLRDAWIEANGLDGVRVASVNAHLTALNVLGNFRVDVTDENVRSENASIRLTKDAAGTYIAGCQIRGGGLMGGRIQVEGDLDMHYAAGNFRIYRSRSVEPIGMVATTPKADRDAGSRIDNPTLNPVTFFDRPEGSRITLIEAGAPKAVIVVDPVHDPRESRVREKQRAGIDNSVKVAAEELQHYIHAATGVTLPIVDAADKPDSGHFIFVGRNRCTDERGIAVDRLQASGFEVRTLNDGVVIIGRDANVDPEYYAESGTLWGVYDFLERFLGIRWYYPGDLGTVMPTSDDLRIEAVHYGDSPHFQKRYYGRFHGSLRNPMPPRSENARHIGAPFRGEDFSGISMATHTFRHWKEKYAADHPEYFEKDADGNIISGNLCYSEPAVLQQLLANVEEDGREVIHVSPDDAPLQCDCPSCRELVHKEDFLGEYSQVVGEFVFRLATAVKARWPERTVMYLPYQNYTKAPKGIKFPDNVTVHICHTRPLAFHKEPQIYREETAIVEAWNAALTRPLGHYHYINTWPDEDTYAPFQFRHTMQRFFQNHRDSFGSYNDGVLAFDWARQHLTTYLYMRLLWNPDFDVDAAYEEYCRVMYGAAADAVKGIFDILNDRWEQSRWSDPLPPYHFLDLKSVHVETYPPEVVAELRRLYKQACDSVAKDSIEGERVAYLDRKLQPFFAESEAFHEAESSMMLSVGYVAQLPAVDEHFDRDFWEAITPQKMGAGYDATAAPPEIGTDVRGVWSDEGVVFAFRLEEPDMGNIKANVTGRDERSYSDDSIEMFLDPVGTRGDFFHIAVNSLGTVFDGRWSANPYSLWNGDGIVTAVHKMGNEWWLEVLLPLDDLEVTRIEADKTHWFGNFTRSRWRDKFELYRLRTADKPPRRSNNLNMNHFGRIIFTK